MFVFLSRFTFLTFLKILLFRRYLDCTFEICEQTDDKEIDRQTDRHAGVICGRGSVIL